jgi:hypothetical protein
MAKIYNEKFKGQVKWMKPSRFAHYKTSKELACALQIDPRTLKRLEGRGIIPEPARVKRGRLSIRLYSPENEDEIKRILKEGKFRKKRGPKSRGQESTT